MELDTFKLLILIRWLLVVTGEAGTELAQWAVPCGSHQESPARLYGGRRGPARNAVRKNVKRPPAQTEKSGTLLEMSGTLHKQFWYTKSPQHRKLKKTQENRVHIIILIDQICKYQCG